MRINLSPSAVATFKRDPAEYRLRYIEKIVPLQEADSLRVGSTWHELLENYQQDQVNGYERDEAFDRGIARLNEQYAELPPYKTAQEWAEERAQLAALFAGYHWYYQDDTIETLFTEQRYELLIENPNTGEQLSIREACRKGVIDRIIIRNGRVMVQEYKTTSRHIHGNSDYWNKWSKNQQLTAYVDAVRELQDRGEIGGVDLCEGVLLDVVRKPSISMKRLSQKDMAEFIENGLYYGTEFEVYIRENAVYVDGYSVDTEYGKSGKPTVLETPDMYMARILFDIYNEPEKYFVRREFARTDRDIELFRRDTFAVYLAIKSMLDSGFWFRNENATEPGFKSEYTPLLEQEDVDEICEKGLTPDGFTRWDRQTNPVPA